MSNPTQVSTPDPKPTISSAATAYDNLGLTYEAAFITAPARLRSLSWLIQKLSSRKAHSDGGAPKVLDIGCGTGKPTALTLADAGLRVYGIDVSPKMIELCQQQVPEAKFAVADARTWEPPYGGESYDAITVYFSLIIDVVQSEIREVISRVYEWLAPGGLLVFATVPMEGEKIRTRFMGQDVIVSNLSAEGTIEAIRDAGFVVVKQETADFMPDAEKAGVKEEDVREESELFVYACKPPG